MPIWKTETALMNRLTTAQNHPANLIIDIMTFAGMCDSREELERHVERYEARAAEQPARRPRNRAAR